MHQTRQKIALLSLISRTQLEKGCFDGILFVTNEISASWAGRINNNAIKIIKIN